LLAFPFPILAYIHNGVGGSLYPFLSFFLFGFLGVFGAMATGETTLVDLPPCCGCYRSDLGLEFLHLGTGGMDTGASRRRKDVL
jgi:hypothetical protein